MRCNELTCISKHTMQVPKPNTSINNASSIAITLLSPYVTYGRILPGRHIAVHLPGSRI